MIFVYRICQLLLSAANLVNLIYDIYITDEFVTHIFIGYSTMNVSIYSENRRDIYFSPQKRLKHGRQNITFTESMVIRSRHCLDASTAFLSGQYVYI